MIENLFLTNGVISIDKSAFMGCWGLKNVHIFNSIASIKKHAFYDCKNLTNIIFQGTKAQWEAIEKENAWDDGAGSYIVHCTDGDILKQNA